MKLLFENWRRFLSEKKWEDYDVPKNQWHNIPLEDIKKAAEEQGGEINIASELYDLIDVAYQKIGGHFDFQSPEDLPSDYTDWIAVNVDNDPQPDALRVSKEKEAGQKMSAAGHDGSRAAINAYVAKTAELLKSGGFYGEMSKGVAHVMITRHGVPFVGQHEDVEKVLGKTVKWVGTHPEGKYPGYDGWYIRKIGGEHQDMKIMLGRPNGIKVSGMPENEKDPEIENTIEEFSFNSAKGSQHRWGKGQPIIDYSRTEPSGAWTYTATTPGNPNDPNSWGEVVSKRGEELEAFLMRVEKTFRATAQGSLF